MRHGPFWNFTYLLACPETRIAAVIDPSWDASAILDAAEANGLAITAALFTHSHTDHANAAAAVVEATGARVVAHAAEVAGLRAHFPGEVTTFEDGDVLELGSLQVRLLHTPGHTEGSATFLAGGVLFTGDTLNVRGPGAPGAEQGAVGTLWQSTRRLCDLQGVHWLHPGHDAGPAARASFDDERRHNPALLAPHYEQFLAVVERATGRRFGP